MKTKIFFRGFYVLACATALIFSSCAEKVTPLDWPQFKKDNFRSACVEADFDLSHFGELWMYDTGQEPIPAWYGPAKEDAYARSGALPSMRDYDLSYYPVIVGSSLYYASSADDAVHCHDVKTGKEKWCFTTEAPIRIAPTYYEGKIYVGSDDGYVYCLNARSGSLAWKYSPTADKKERLLNNGRFISFYPIRTGVLIEDGLAYFGASLLPWKKSYVCAIDAESGEVGKEGTYVQEYDTNSMTLEGSMASTGSLLIQPQGRISPVFIKKGNGKTAGNLAGTGGCFVLVTPEQNVVHGQSSRYVSLTETKMEEKQPEFMSYKDGKELLVKGDSAYVLNDNSLVSYNRKTQKMIWLRNHFRAQRIIIAGDILFAGGTDCILGISLKNGQTLWKTNVKGTVYALSFARNRLYASTAEGYLYAFAEGGKGGQYFAENVDKPIIMEELTPVKMERGVQTQDPFVSSGPFIHPFSADSVTLSFDTYQPMKVKVEWKEKDQLTHYQTASLATHHSFRIPVRKGLRYYYSLFGDKGDKVTYYYDNFFNFFTRNTQDFPSADEESSAQVRHFLQIKPMSVGLSLVWGDHSDDIALALATQSELNVVNVKTSSRQYNKFLEQLQERKSYGRKLNALLIDDEERLPVISEIADLVWVNEGEDKDPDEVIRLIAPMKYAVVTGLDNAKEWLAQSTLDWQVSVDSNTEGMLILRKHPFENIGVWTHQHGDMRNASYGGESLFGSNRTEDFETQWMGRPGPRFITDRNGRKPAPLIVDGRLFMQGKEHIVALNIFNGSILWMKDIPGVMRMNMARDCSNWACDSTHVYLATRSHILKIKQLDGSIEKTLTMHLPNDTAYHWGYVGVTPTHIIGTTTTKEAQFTVYHGGGNEGWYDAIEGPNSYKVLSNRMFSVDKVSNQLAWEYVPQGVIINSTICSDNQKMIFVESRSANVESRRTGRGGNDLYQNTHLVALDMHTGKMVYDTRFKTIEGRTVYFMAAGTGKCVVSSSYDGEFDIHTFDIETGKEVWTTKQKWFHSNHGAHMSKPAIAGDRLVVKPAIYNVHTGERANFNTPKAGHGCAHYALSDYAMFYRGASCTMFDFDNRVFSKWERLRPDCWLSTIPAQGMVLSPEAAGGCSCGNWYETSMAFAPISRTPVSIMGHTDDSKRDNMNETWGDFPSSCNTDKFTKDLVVELALKPGLKTDIYYTIDGTEPTKESAVYKSPITLTESADVKVAVYIEKAGKERRFVRSKFFEKVEESKEDKK